MIESGLECNSKLGTKEGGPKLRDQLFHGIGVIAEALAELAIAATLATRPMSVMPISA